METVGGKAIIDHLDRLQVAPGEPEDRLEALEPEEEVTPGKLKKPPTAYFLFASEQRKERPGISVKELGAIWTDMAAEERHGYIQKANLLKEEYVRQVQLRAQNQIDADGNDIGDDRVAGQETQADDDLPADPSDLLNAVFPLGRLKTIAKFDPEASEALKGEAWKTLQQAVYMFASDLITKSVHELMRQKKKKLMPSHLIAVADQEAMYSWLLQANIWGDELGKYQREAEATFAKKKDRFSTPQKEDHRSDYKLDRVQRYKSPKNGMDEERIPAPRPVLLPKPAPTSNKPEVKAAQTTQLTSFFQKRS